MRNSRELERVVWLDAGGNVAGGRPTTCPPRWPIFRVLAAPPLEHARDIRDAAHTAGRPLRPARPAPVLIDYHVPLFHGSHYLGSLVATYTDGQHPRRDGAMVVCPGKRDRAGRQLDDTVLDKRAAGGAGTRRLHAQARPRFARLTLALHTNSVKSAPKLLPNLLVGSVIALSLGLLWSLGALWRDINRTAGGRRRAAPASGVPHRDGKFAGHRPARARPGGPHHLRQPGVLPDGRIQRRTNWSARRRPCRTGRRKRWTNTRTASPWCWPAAHRRSSKPSSCAADGERFPVLVFESPLMDDGGRQTGWMGSILDITERKRVEELEPPAAGKAASQRAPGHAWAKWPRPWRTN